MNDSRNVYGTERLDKWSNVTGVVIIPGWIYRAILRKKLSIEETFSNYKKLRSVLSLDDVADLFYLNHYFKIKNVYFNNGTFFGLSDTEFASLTNAEKLELDTVRPLSYSDKIADNVNARLLGNVNPMSDKLYDFFYVNSKLFFVVNEGFLSNINNNEFLKEVIITFIKKLYEQNPIHEVSKLDIFHLYLKSI